MGNGEREDEVARLRHERDELLSIARMLSAEKDIRKLLDLVLRCSRAVTFADAGSIYIVEPEREAEQRRRRASETGTARLLRFMLSQNDSMPVDFTETTLPVDESSMVGQAVLRGAAIVAANLSSGQAGHNQSFDKRTGYQARSMLTVPMVASSGEVIGVVQLINRKLAPQRILRTQDDFDSQVVPFDHHTQSLAMALASQAGVSLENALLQEEIQQLFHHFVNAAVTAIESRDPTTSGHSRRVATLSVSLAKALDGLSDGPFAKVHFSPEELRQIEYAGVLHDFGKVGVREHVLVKAKRLYPWQRDLIETRLRYVRLAVENRLLRRQVAVLTEGRGVEAAREFEARTAVELAEIDELWSLVQTTNEPVPVRPEVAERIAALGRRLFEAGDGPSHPYLRDDELTCLRIARGTLTDEERSQIQSHVLHTMEFLRTIPWGRSLRKVPVIAGSHHELLDGSGYPLGLRGNAIPVETRMLTIADIYDALTASDRPYKTAVPVHTSLAILEGEAKAGKIDADILAVFIGAGIYSKVT